MAQNELFQYSVIYALMDGAASTGLPIRQVLAQGAHGLGTFRHMDGEMIVLDGEVFQMKSDGSVVRIPTSSSSSSAASSPGIDERAPAPVPPPIPVGDPSLGAAEVVCPFAQITNFKPTARLRTALASKQALTDVLVSCLASPSASPEGKDQHKNHFVAFRLDGTFQNITFRTAGGQGCTGEGLVAVVARQGMHTFTEPVKGTVIGFRSPAWSHGLSVEGEHLHFITDDRTKGGHVLALETVGEVDVQAAVMADWRVRFPLGDREFEGATLSGGHDAIRKAEG